jgi:hypothetical protein
MCWLYGEIDRKPRQSAAHRGLLSTVRCLDKSLPWIAPCPVYSNRPFDGRKEVLRYLACYTHRVAISNRRLVACDDKGVTFKWKDYRIDGPERYKVMTLTTPRVRPPFLDACAARRLPPHPLLWPARRR